MVTIRKVTAADFEEVYTSLLVQFRSAELTREDYRRLFIRQWDSAEDWHGFAMVDDGVIVGFIGLIFATRPVRGTPRRFVNISHWIVQPPYRGPQSLSLLFQVLKLPDCTLTTFTPTPAVTPLYDRLKWPELDHRCHIIPPLPWIGLPGRGPRLHFLAGEVEARLQGEELRIFRDHLPYKCGHLYVEDGGEGCYVVFTRVTRKHLPFVLIHHIGNVPVFARAIGRIRAALCLRQRAVGLLVDERFLDGRRIFGTVVYQGERRFFFNTGKAAVEDPVTARDVDSLYSEYIVTKV